MTTLTTPLYGNDTLECFKFAQDEFDALLSRKTAMYNRFSQGLHYQATAAHIDVIVQKPLAMAIAELQDYIRDGFSVVKADYVNLYFTATLRKPEATIAVELAELEAATMVEYETNRYERNKVETQRLIKEAIANKQRDAAAAAAAVAAKQAAKEAASDEQKALDVLRATFAQVTAA